MLANAAVAVQALGATVDMTSRTMGERTRRFAMYLDDGEVTSLTIPPLTAASSG